MDNNSNDGSVVGTEESKVHRRGRGFKKTESGITGRLHMDEIQPLDVDAEKSIEGWTIIVLNVHREASEEDVLDKFSEFGTVKTIHLNLDRNDGYVKGYALLEYNSQLEAQKAILEMHHQLLLGQKIECSFAFVKGKHQNLPTRKISNNNNNSNIRNRLGNKSDINSRIGNDVKRSINDRLERRVHRDHPDFDIKEREGKWKRNNYNNSNRNNSAERNRDRSPVRRH